MSDASDDRFLAQGTFSKANRDSFGITPTTEIKLLPDLDAYKVTEYDVAGNPPRMTLTFQGKDLHPKYWDAEAKCTKTATLLPEIKIEGTQRFTIGRDAGSNAAINHGSISRSHLSIHYDGINKQFVMTALNMNPGEVKNVRKRSIEEVTHIAAAAETISDFRVSEEKDTEVLLRPGMTLRLLPHMSNVADIPAYTVKTAVSGVKPELELVMTGDTSGYPDDVKVIRLSGKDDSKSIGSITGNNVTIPHDRLSRFHASLYYDEHQKSWMYLTQKVPPVVNIGSQFLQEMRDRADALRPADLGKAKLEIAEIDKLIGEMQTARDHMPNAQELMMKVQGHEQNTLVTPPEKRERGGKTEESQRGYKHWLHAYKLLYQDDMPRKDMESLNRAMGAMETMERQRVILRDVESYASFPSLKNSRPADILSAVRKANYNEDMQEVVSIQTDPLRKKPPEPAILVSGYRGHHTVTKVEQDQSGYKVTTYNAGAESKMAPDGEHVMAIYVQHLNRGVKAEDFICLIDERKVRTTLQGDGHKIDEALESMVGKVESFVEQPPQHKGNCTTRSTREMLRDMLTPERFAHLHRHVSNPDVCDPADIMAGLQLRRNALAAAVHVEKPKGQRDWAQSVSDFHISQSQSSQAGFSAQVQRTPSGGFGGVKP